MKIKGAERIRMYCRRQKRSLKYYLSISILRKKIRFVKLENQYRK